MLEEQQMHNQIAAVVFAVVPNVRARKSALPLTSFGKLANMQGHV